MDVVCGGDGDGEVCGAGRGVLGEGGVGEAGPVGGLGYAGCADGVEVGGEGVGACGEGGGGIV